jgi:hypothetical protein
MFARASRLSTLLLFAALGGCTWGQHRLVDLGDCFLWRWYPDALGAAVEAKLGPLDVAVGGWYSETGIGKDTYWQRPGEVMTRSGIGLPVTTLSPLVYGDSWARIFATSALGNHPGAPDAFLDTRSWLGISDVFDLDDRLPFALSPARRISELFGVEVGLVAVFVGARVGFNVAEFVDLVLGCVGVDVFGDDGVERPPTRPFLPADGR